MPSLSYVAALNQALRDELQSVLERKRGEIDAILASYGVPRVDATRHSSAPVPGP